MWGFALDDSFEGVELEAVSVPGPRLTVPAGDTTLTIHLDNNLLVPISIVIPGQVATMTPVFFTDGQGRQRVYSFTHETSAGNTTMVDYAWTNLKPGTYLYLSGTHPAVQVQMGLYGAVTNDVVPAGAEEEAYPDVTYDAEVLLLYSEIDPALHSAVDDGSYGTTGPTSTVDYRPKYFLINGEPYTATTLPMSAGVMGDRVLLRFLNAGLQTHVPNLLGMYMNVIAEDGNPYNYPKNQYSLPLPAGQTKDAIVVPSADGTYPLIDRMANVTNAGGFSLGGMVRFLDVAP
jgi:FtsP/CotA-like multicopper oxidase with cupredoxin domain